MSFIGQAAKIFDNLAEIKFQIVLFGRDALYIEGAKPLKIDCDEMIFRARNSVLVVLGENLTVKELSGDCVSIVGKVNDIKVTDL